MSKAIFQSMMLEIHDTFSQRNLWPAGYTTRTVRHTLVSKDFSFYGIFYLLKFGSGLSRNFTSS